MTGMLKGIRILVVEDEMLVMMYLEGALRDLGCSELHTVTNVAKALEVLAMHQIDLAILDINLNGERSDPIADSLIARDIPFAFSTGYSNHENREDLEARPVLRKPYLANDVAVIMNRLLGK